MLDDFRAVIVNVGREFQGSVLAGLGSRMQHYFGFLIPPFSFREESQLWFLVSLGSSATAIYLICL